MTQNGLFETVLFPRLQETSLWMQVHHECLLCILMKRMAPLRKKIKGHCLRQYNAGTHISYLAWSSKTVFIAFNSKCCVVVEALYRLEDCQRWFCSVLLSLGFCVLRMNVTTGQKGIGIIPFSSLSPNIFKNAHEEGYSPVLPGQLNPSMIKEGREQKSTLGVKA